MGHLTSAELVAFLADVIERRGGESYLGEAVNMREHMLQTASLAELAGASDAVVAGALLHDIGHYTGEFPEDALELGTDNRHQETGARFLEPYFPSLVIDCVRHHVTAKRFLCATDSGYRSMLSDPSVRSLELQGGPLDAAECARFASHPDLEALTAVRRWDDEAKAPGRVTPAFGHYRPLLESLIQEHSASAREG